MPHDAQSGGVPFESWSETPSFFSTHVCASTSVSSDTISTVTETAHTRASSSVPEGLIQSPSGTENANEVDNKSYSRRWLRRPARRSRASGP